jgi:DNA-binding CsgD family transcriptional regulator
MKKIIDAIIHDIRQEIPVHEFSLPKHRHVIEDITKAYPVLLTISRLPTMLPVYFCKKGLPHIGITPDANTRLEHELITTLMHRENLSVITSAMQHFNERPGDDFGHPYRVKTGHKTWRWVYGYSRSVNFLSDGSADLILSIFSDIESNMNHGKAILPITREPMRQEDITRLNNLTMRERAVLRLLSDGMNDERIAWELRISPHTALSHRRSLYRKLGVDHHTQAIKYAFLFDHLHN